MARHEVPFGSLKGEVIVDLDISDDEIQILTFHGHRFKMYHNQDCCETVYIDDIVGDIADVMDSVIILAEEISNVKAPQKEDWNESYTWTFYRLGTNKGSITIKWYGGSNGYYSETVDFMRWING